MKLLAIIVATALGVLGQTSVDLNSQVIKTEMNYVTVTYLTPTTLGFGVGCSTTKPCNLRVGTKVLSVQTSCIATVASGSALTYFYFKDGGLVFGSTATQSASAGCSFAPGITDFPDGSIPIWRCTATSGAWVSTSCVNFNAPSSTTNVTGRTGVISSTDVNGNTILDVDTSVVALRVSVPSSASATCTAGTWALSTTFFYNCVATNSWVRVAVAAW